MKLWKRVVSLTVAACMLLAVGCAGQDRTWAYQLNDTQLPVGVYIYYMAVAETQAQSELMEANADNADYTLPEDHDDLLKEEIDGQTVADYIKAQAEKSVREYFAIEQETASRSITLTDEETEYAENLASNAYESSTIYEKNGIGQDSLVLLVENGLKENKLFEALYGTEGENAVSEDALREEFLSSYAKVDLMFYTQPTETTEGEDAEAAEDPHDDANAFLARLNAGEDFYTILNDVEKQEYDEQQAEAVAEGSITEDEVTEYTAVEDGTYAMLFTDDMRSAYGDTLVDGVFGVEPGSSALIEDDNYIYVVKRIDMTQTDDFDENRDQVLSDMKGEEFLAWLDEIANGLELTANEAALKYYKPSRLDLEEDEEEEDAAAAANTQTTTTTQTEDTDTSAE